MLRHKLAALTIALAAASITPSQEPASLNIPLYKAQGEYAGTLVASVAEGWSAGPVGAQLIALTDQQGSNARLRMVLYHGGLPGSGWNRNDLRITTEASFQNSVANFTQGFTATVAITEAKLQKDSANLTQGLRAPQVPKATDNPILSIRSVSGKLLGKLQKTTRQSPTLGSQAPPGAVVLFDGKSADAFKKGRITKDGTLAAGCDSKRGFADHRIHLEFKTPFKPAARGQGRGNSGVYVQGRYECQVLDSFGLAGEQNECGGVYSIAKPIVNACLPPQTWQSYDIVFTAAKFVNGEKKHDARMTVHLNGMLVHDDLALTHATTAHRRTEGPGLGGIYLQDHGNAVEYRNIWVVEHDANRARKVVFLAGRRSHGYGSHEHMAGCKLLAQALEASDLNLKTTVINLWPKDESILDEADVIVSFADGGGGHPLLRHIGKIDELMASGVGLVCIHYAVEVPTGKPGDNWLRWLGGYFETHWSVNPHWTAAFLKLPEHAITRGVQPFTINDEWYFHMRFPAGMQSVTPILSAIAPQSTMQRPDGPHSGNSFVRASVAKKSPQHVGWAHTRPDGGRSFGFTGGHKHWNWAHNDFRKVVLNAICWCAHLPVPKNGIHSKTPTLADLQANQDHEPGKGFDEARVQRMINSFTKKN